MDRDHAHRRAPDVRGRAGQSRGESLADTPRPGPGRARPSRLHPRHLGALAQYPAPGLHRQYAGARARGHRARHAAARAVHRDRARRPGRPDRRPRRADVQAAGRAHADGGGAALHPRGSGGRPRRVHAHLQSLRHHQRLRGPRHLERGPRGVPGRARAGPAERAGASLVEPGLAVRRSRARARPRAELGRLAEPPRARRRVPARGRALHGIGLLGGKPPARGHVAQHGLGRLLLPGGAARGRHGRDDDRGREKPHPRRQLHAEYPRPLRAREPRRAHRGPAVGHRAHRRLRPG